MVERKRLVEEESEEPLRKKPGPKSSYNPKYAKIAKTLCSRGATDSELADAFGVSTVTIQTWQSTWPDFGEAVKAGKAEIFDPKIERALSQLALGFWMDVEEVKVTKDGDEVRYTVRKYYPPNPASVFFWLKNRQPDKWRDVWKIDQTVKIEEKLTSEELLEEIRKEAIALGLMPAEAAKLIAGVGPAKESKGNGTKH